MRYKMLTMLVVITLLIASCTPQQKLERLIEKQPELFEKKEVAVIITDTVTVKDTVIVEKMVIDEMFDRIPGRDAKWRIENDEYITEVEILPPTLEELNINAVEERVRVKTIIKERTIIETDTIPIKEVQIVEVDVPKPIYKKRTPKWSWWLLVINILIVLFLLYLFKNTISAFAKSFWK